MKDVNIMIGRFQPFTGEEGHLKCINAAVLENGFPVVVCMISNTKFDEKHPFTDKLIQKEMDIIRRSNKNIEKTMYVKNGYYPDMVAQLKEEGYEVHALVCGTDRADSYRAMAERTRKKPESNPLRDDFHIIEVPRDDNAVSASKVREMIKNDDLEGFKQVMPKGTERLFKELQKELTKISEQEGMMSLQSFLESVLN